MKYLFDKSTSRRAGFTLIELLVSIAIISILIASLATATNSARQTAKIAKANTECNNLANAIRLYCLITETEAPITTLGLSTGTSRAEGTFMKELSEPTASNGNRVFFEAPTSMKSGGAFNDPWGNPYRVRVVALDEAKASEKLEYTIVAPLPAVYQATSK